MPRSDVSIAENLLLDRQQRELEDMDIVATNIDESYDHDDNGISDESVDDEALDTDEEDGQDSSIDTEVSDGELAIAFRHLGCNH